MTIEERKIALINWITNLEDENIEDCIEHSYPSPEPVEGKGFGNPTGA